MPKIKYDGNSKLEEAAFYLTNLSHECQVARTSIKDIKFLNLEDPTKIESVKITYRHVPQLMFRSNPQYPYLDEIPY